MISTGYPSIDRVIGGGLIPGKSLRIYSRPMAFKTSLSCCVALSLAQRNHKTLIATTATESEIAERLVCLSSGVSDASFRAGELNKPERERAIVAGFSLGDLPLHVFQVKHPPSILCNEFDVVLSDCCTESPSHDAEGRRAAVVEFLYCKPDFIPSEGELRLARDGDLAILSSPIGSARLRCLMGPYKLVETE